MFRRSSQAPLWILAMALLAALPVLAFLQYRWLGQLHQAETVRMEGALDRGLTAFRRDFDRELHQLYIGFQPPLGSHPGTTVGRWRERTAYPALLDGALFGVAQGEGVAWWRLAGGTVEPATAPADLEQLFGDDGSSRGGPYLWADRWLVIHPPAPPLAGTSSGNAATSLLPLLLAQEAEAGPYPSRLRLQGLALRIPAHHLLAVPMDRFREELVAAIAQRYLPTWAEGFDYGLQDAADPPALVAASAAVRTLADLEPADRRIEVLRPQDFPFGTLSSQFATEDLEGIDAADLDCGDGEAGEGVPCGGDQIFFHTFSGPADRRWALTVRHRQGSLGSVLDSARSRNLAVSAGVLAVLGAGLALLAVLVVRSQRLARAQMDFVAGVSHELRTPLAVISSAGANLADGLVDEPQRVRLYGAQLQRESRRLRELVERVLTFAKLGGGRLETGPVEIEPLVRRVLDEVKAEIEERGLRVETRFSPTLPPARAHAAALESALGNLVGNAIKYGAEGGLLEVEADLENGAGGAEVRIAVRDRGPGIAPEDRRRLFEPFYRGRAARRRQLPGTGLGLNLVRRVMQALGGRVSLDTAHSPGAAFLLHVPAISPEGGG